MKKIYVVETWVVDNIVVAADSPEEARELAEQGLVTELREGTVFVDTEEPVEAKTMAQVPAIWRGCEPFGSDGELTEEFFKDGES